MPSIGGAENASCFSYSPDEWRAMVLDMMEARFTRNLRDRDASIRAFERHNDAVRAGRALPIG